MRKVALGATAAAILVVAAGPTLSRGQTGEPVDCANRPTTTDLRTLQGFRGEPVKLAVPWSYYPGCDEPGDKLTVTVDWGDGSQSPGKTHRTPGDDRALTLTAKHVYTKASAQPYAIVVTIRNDRTGVAAQDRHYVAVVSEPLDVHASVTPAGRPRPGALVVIGGRTRELIAVSLRSVRGLRVNLATRAAGRKVGSLTLTGPASRRFTLRAPATPEPDRVVLLHRGKLAVVLDRKGALLLEAGAFPKGTTGVILHFYGAGRGILRRLRGCSSATLLRVDAQRRRKAPVDTTVPVGC